MLNQLEDIKDTLFKYFETRIDLFKIETRDKIERVVIMAIYAGVIAFIALTIFILIVILLGTFLNKWLNSDYLGFLILLGVFVIALIVCFTLKENIIRFIRRMIVRFTTIKED